ncbi:MAG TPA: SAM-dependent methyltransferase, partial [Fervidobacterium sp.]|nr:SAM-dependent methyltransferase [Fervidobacterium sp.]
TNQVSAVLERIYEHPFVEVQVWESMMRQYKPYPNRLRPYDRMVAHTTFMVFARKVKGFAEIIEKSEEDIEEKKETKEIKENVER